MRKVFQIIQTETEAAEAISGAEGADAIQSRETVIKKYHSVLHPRHAFLTTLKCVTAMRYQLSSFHDVPNSCTLPVQRPSCSLRHPPTRWAEQIHRCFLS